MMQKNKTLEFVGNTVLLAWFAICIVIFMYYPGAISHMQGASLYNISSLPEKISKITITTYLLDTLKSILGMSFLGISCVSLGMRLGTFFRLENDIHKQTVMLAATYFLIGSAAFSLVFLAIASVWSLSPTLSFVLLSLGILSGLTRFRSLAIQTPQIKMEKGKVLVYLSIAILAVSVFQSSARISYDASAFYFSNAKLTALEQYAGYFMENTFVAGIFHSVILFSPVMQIFGDQSARMITWLFGIVNIVISLAIARHADVTVLARRLLVILILTSTAFLDLMGDGKVDLISSAYSLAVVYWVTAKERDQNRAVNFLSGCFIGFACILRPYNAFLLGIFIFIQFIQEIQKKRLLIIEAVRQISWMALGAVGFAIYHLLINKILLGSPFAFWSVIAGISPINGPWDFDPKTVWIERFLYPIIVTFKNSPASLGSITPLILIFLPALTIRDVRKRITISQPLSRLALSAGIALYSWIFLFFTIAEIRYVFFLWFILFIPLAEVAVSTFQTENAFIRNMVKGSVILVLGFILIRSAYISISKYAPIDADGNPQCIGDVLCGHLPSINDIAGRGDRVLNMSAFRYYLRTDLFACSTQVEEYEKLRDLSFNDNDAFWREVYRMGFSYVAFEEDYATRHLLFSDAPLSNLPDWVELTPIITSSENLRITSYKFTGINPPVEVEIVCRQDEVGIWRLRSQ